MHMNPLQEIAGTQFDIQTVWCGKVGMSGHPEWYAIPIAAFLQALEHQAACHSGGLWLHPDPNTLRIIPWENQQAACLCESGEVEASDGQRVSSRMLLAHLERTVRISLGLEPQMSVALQFCCVQVGERSPFSPGGVRIAGQQNMTLHALQMNPRPFCNLLTLLEQAMRNYGIALQEPGWKEAAPGVYEYALVPGSPLAVADQATLLRDGLKKFLRALDLVPIFSSSLLRARLSLSFWDLQQTRNFFWEKEETNPIPLTMRLSLAGLQATSQEFAALYACQPQPSLSDASADAQFGPDVQAHIGYIVPTNLRTRDACIENALPPANTNLYLALSAMLMSAMYGIQNKPLLPVQAVGDSEKTFFTLEEALAALQSTAAKACLEPDFLQAAR